MTELKEMIREVLNEESGYQDFFKATLDKFGVKSPAELEGGKKKEFFDYIDANWDAKKETDIDETLEPVSQADGPKRVKARKRDQILAAEAKVETYVRKIVKEELKFVLFSEIPGGVSRKVAKKRIAQKGSVNTNSTI